MMGRAELCTLNRRAEMEWSIVQEREARLVIMADLISQMNPSLGY